MFNKLNINNARMFNILADAVVAPPIHTPRGSQRQFKIPTVSIEDY
jgi:hypothetical protein